ncbi:MAG TPA: alpha/beta family hydrolase [Burkholderiales bacterium]|nr:alpha/beta family hydrolase [Burkholderiales bacterium]
MGAAQEWHISVGLDATVARYEPATASRRATFVCAHGAGGHMDDRGMLALVRELRGRGLDVVRFNFLYRAKGAKAPDRMPLLQDCYKAVIERARTELAPEKLLIGGRSMGGRTASMLAADGYGCDGLLLFAYPLHPAGKPEKLRDEHLPRIRVPVLCFNGTRDTLCTQALMEQTLERLGTSWTMHWLDGADHSFHVLKSSGRSDAAVLDEVGDACERWLAENY